MTKITKDSKIDNLMMRINNKVLFATSNMLRTFEVLLISIILSRYIDDKNELGELLQILFISSILTTFISGIPLSLNFFFGKYQQEKMRNLLFGKFIFIISLVSFILCLLILIFKSTISLSFQNEAFNNFIYIILFFYLIKLINTIFPNYHYLKNRLYKFLLFYLFTTIFLIGFFFFDYKTNNFNIEVVLMQLLCVECLRFLINFFIIKWKELKFSLRTLRKKEFYYILNVSIGVVLGAFSLYVDKYLIAIFLNPTDFVFYQNGAINLPFVNIITSSLFIASIPIFAELYSKGKIEVLVKEVKIAIIKCSIFLIPILVYSFFEAVSLITFLYGDDFEISGEVFKIYILRYLLSVMAFSVFMCSIGLEKKANFIILISAVTSVILNIILIPEFGIKGAAWATVIASLSTIGISFYFIKNRLKVDVTIFFPVKSYFKILTFSILLYVPFHFLNEYFISNGMVVIFAVLYYLIMILLLNATYKIFNMKKFINRVQ